MTVTELIPEQARPLLDGDIRTDIPLHRVYVDGELVEETTDVTGWWSADVVGFLIGCSFTFERALAAAGVPVRHVEQGVDVAMYRTSRRCRPAGSVAGPLVVSMRPVPAALVRTAVRVTAAYPSVHGAPVHVGDPAAVVESRPPLAIAHAPGHTLITDARDRDYRV